MKKLLFIVLILFSSHCFADGLKTVLNSIESDWATAYYGLPKQKQQAAYSKLLNKLQALVKLHPNDASVLYWQALIKAAAADHQSPLTALQMVNEVRDLLTKAIAINPEVMNGAAYIVLGTLYDEVPSWPIGFGNDDTAKNLLETALKINPNGIESNFFYGKFLLSHDDKQAAEHYFNLALAAPIRPEQIYADQQMKLKVEYALKKLN